MLIVLIALIHWKCCVEFLDWMVNSGQQLEDMGMCLGHFFGTMGLSNRFAKSCGEVKRLFFFFFLAQMALKGHSNYDKTGICGHYGLQHFKCPGLSG